MSLSSELGLASGLLENLAREAPSRYKAVMLPRQGRAPRRIDAPDEELKGVQKRILRRLLVRLGVSPQAHGFVRGRSAVSAAGVHAGRELLVTFDIREFFPSVTSGAVEAVAGELGLDRRDCRLLVALVTLRGRLPQGAPTSPKLANLAFRRCDARLAGLAASLGLSYSRYADDLAFSGGRTCLRIEASVRKVLQEHGFRLADEKKRVMSKSDRQEFCGLVVNGGVKLPRERRRRLRAILHDLAENGPEAAARGRGEVFIEWLCGHLAYMAAVDGNEAARLVKRMEEALTGEADTEPRRPAKNS